jgi:tetratricopeptide (TPR) repeat protein
MKKTILHLSLAAAGLLFATGIGGEGPREWYDPVLEPGAFCGGAEGGQPVLLRKLIVAAKTETAPFQPVPPQPALGQKPVLYGNLGNLHFPISSKSREAQKWFDQGLILAFGFNHAESQRAFREAQALDPGCAICYWAESLVLGPNINVPMMPEANAPALAALARAVELAPKASPKEQALIAALEKRYSADPKADRAALDRAFAEAMKGVAARFPKDDTIQVLYAEALMDTQPWDYWEVGGMKPKGAGIGVVATLERVLARNPDHAGAAHFYIHAVEASARPEKALPAARKLASLAPGAGHLVHMPAHIYFRIGMYRESLEANRKAMAVDERYFTTSPSDPLYKVAYYPHNIHFVMVSAQMGGDAATAIEAAGKLDASIPAEVAKQFAIMQPVKGSFFTTHAHFSDAEAILALPAPGKDLVLVEAMYHYARAVAHAQRKDAAAAKAEIAALAKIEKAADFKPFAEYQVPAKEIVQTARLVAAGRLADAMGDLEGAAKAYEEAIFIEDTLSYMEPPYWYYPVRQSLGSVRLRQGRLAEAETAFRDSLAKVRNNGWALAGLAETYKRMGNARAEKATRAAMAKAWFGERSGPQLARL